MAELQGTGKNEKYEIAIPIPGCYISGHIEVKAKTISTDFDEQLDVSERLYGRNLRFHFTKKQGAELLKKAVGYEEEIRNRVASILYLQMDKYRYLWK